MGWYYCSYASAWLILSNFYPELMFLIPLPLPLPRLYWALGYSLIQRPEVTSPYTCGKETGSMRCCPPLNTWCPLLVYLDLLMTPSWSASRLSIESENILFCLWIPGFCHGDFRAFSFDLSYGASLSGSSIIYLLCLSPGKLSLDPSACQTFKVPPVVFWVCVFCFLST